MERTFGGCSQEVEVTEPNLEADPDTWLIPFLSPGSLWPPKQPDFKLHSTPTPHQNQAVSS